jgi:excinuclease UvrABC nuclease subunit
MTKGIFQSKLTPFTIAEVRRVPSGSGVYIVYERSTGRAMYVGRSRRDIRERLLKHVMRIGSRKIAAALSQGSELLFEFQHMMSPEQAESQLIIALRTVGLFNLRRETDPADL